MTHWSTHFLSAVRHFFSKRFDDSTHSNLFIAGDASCSTCSGMRVLKDTCISSPSSGDAACSYLPKNDCPVRCKATSTCTGYRVDISVNTTACQTVSSTWVESSNSSFMSFYPCSEYTFIHEAIISCYLTYFWPFRLCVPLTTASSTSTSTSTSKPTSKPPTTPSPKPSTKSTTLAFIKYVEKSISVVLVKF